MVLQLAGWASMFAKYCSETGYVQAVEMTFDGKNPCAMCRAVDAEVRSELGTESTAKESGLKTPPKPTDKVTKQETPLIAHEVEVNRFFKSGVHWELTALGTPPLRPTSPETPPPRV
jgi:hypothetical protein